MKALSLLIVGGSLLATVTIGQSALSAPGSTAPAPGVAEGGVYFITLPIIPVDLPAAPGRDSVSSCTFCHSPRYILNQPMLTRKQWTATVDKMRKTFGAPIPEPQVPQILDYLMTIRGKQDSKAAPSGKS